MHIANTAHPTGTGFYKVVALKYVEGNPPRSPLPLPDTHTHWTLSPGPATGEECWHDGLPLVVPHGGAQSCDPLDIIHLPGMAPYIVQRTVRFQSTPAHCSLVLRPQLRLQLSPSALLPLAVFALLFMLQRIFHNAFILTCTLTILYMPLGHSYWPSPFGQRAATRAQRCLLGTDAQGMNSSFLTD